MKEKSVFVIMPFSATTNHTEAEWLEVFENLFQPAFEECGYCCERAMPRTGNLISSIIEKLHSVQIVLADLTDHNPNVFYELGVRHSLSKRTIIVSQEGREIPSDLRGYWALAYSTTLPGAAQFKNDMHRIVAELEAEPERTDSPVAEYLERENLTAYRHVQMENVKKLGALMTEISGNALTLQAIRWKPDDGITRKLVSTQCLELLLSTQYVDIGPEFLKDAYEVNFHLRRITLGDDSDVLSAVSSSLLQVLGDGIAAIRDKLLSHEYEEPPTPSTMLWGSPEKQLSRFCFQFAGLLGSPPGMKCSTLQSIHNVVDALKDRQEPNEEPSEDAERRRECDK